MSDPYELALYGYVNDKVARKTLKVLRDIGIEEPGRPIDLMINSPGGAMEHGDAIYDELVRMSENGGGGHHITTRVRGQAASVASLILQAGDARLGGRMSYVYMHEPLSTFHDHTMAQMRNELEFCEKWVERYIKAHNRCTLAYNDFRERIRDKEWYLAMDEAVALGIVDGIG
ncbi:ATP-dependent Clp protease proteolytic subunit [Mycobacteroides abscessus subsp. massiliense]|uniref:ATP-dependent Clp protease proteolytic subunit n=1 Tax=Mycobacteroides abscessus TaxID=36809 RepID=UPI0009A6DED5|nr:ATP-dependent Clp protease proteolytic subunit [Mycobacteroides abscessus]SKU88504.1 ATP-dependent Clp protease proteolytic subunit [Mycobacteroides abscessus subsp. massiliense]SKU96588.1 ATP-dependent Clp protease proteolytic subunit [Mycobacteroides abscessus subsp. massiliense]